ncbi:MAG: 2-C-methyl-D-erythritol 4-phosphate cytidylyltransferase [Nitrospirae bacterium]|nr:MAG: 2-C-methyl-D-erythritol 4-phosphate cytidylyltransferase [Nitrospirota bacterium]
MRKVAVVCGAGSGIRFGGDKVFATLWGRPVFYWSLKAFEDFDEIDEIIPVVRDEMMDTILALCRDYGIKKVKRVVTGGPRRQDSVLNGLEALEDDALVFVHDAARPVLRQSLLKRLNGAFTEGVDGVVPGISPPDTVKETEDHSVKRTLKRENLILVQTPQVFLSSTLKRAYTMRDILFTDDASAVEASGGRVVYVEGDRFNIKVTTREDLIILESIGRQVCQS